VVRASRLTTQENYLGEVHHMKSAIRTIVLAASAAAVSGLIGAHLSAGQDKKDKVTSTIEKAQDKVQEKTQDKVKEQDKKEKAAAVGSFELYKDKGGEFRFRLNDPKGNLLAIAAKGYEKKADCQAVIDAIKRDASKAKLDDQTK
jgi:uncharacterized protein YegP (UPF0339 family)